MKQYGKAVSDYLHPGTVLENSDIVHWHPKAERNFPCGIF
jgi:hypothetical protein